MSSWAKKKMENIPSKMFLFLLKQFLKVRKEHHNFQNKALWRSESTFSSFGL